MPEFVRVRLFSSEFLVTPDMNEVRQVLGRNEKGVRARVLEPSVLTQHIIGIAREYMEKEKGKDRGVKRVIQ